ncbi:MAG: ammonia-forming cytochrome c nitrite reductase subunit c552 [Ignavibacteria bacterium GWA2_35_9]|nr:MAG: ammonia-forming cytochrome c nitrite reductase subunit c552 [Ignavibacteria bacterium GWA2_35_9]OGU53018.1 MAG: ammonia-forming cytochrome c nitrite reductase subunit c552 [Ignavibacteria bacterium GWC2_36_12]
MRRIKDIVAEKPWVGWAIFFATLIIVFFVGLFGSSIIERRTEATLRFQPVEEIAEWEPRNEVWGENFPRQHQTYIQTKDTTFRSKYLGTALIDMLDREPDMVILWAGYAFSRDYNQARGHYYAVKDIRNTLRTGVKQPATCWTCKSTDVPRLMNEIGVANFYKKGWLDLGDQVVNHIGCQDCHDPKTMDLRITRPAFVEAFKRQGKDITKATHQEMRTYVCAQCHVEYYFAGEEKYLTFPWDNGFSVEDIEEYYDNIDFVDFVHALSKTPMIKAQHPDFELSKMGIHSQRGVACADCHMPYMSEGSVKFTDHHIQSPLNNMSRSCQVCHRESELDLTKNVYDRQDANLQLTHVATNTLVKAHIEAKTAWDNGASEEQMKPILKLIRAAQWRWDFATAGHGSSFHAPLEVARVLAHSIGKGEQARVELAKLLTSLGVKLPVTMPDFSTKEKAQEYLGLDMNKFKKEKEEFLLNVVPEWDKKAEERQGKMKY